MSESSGLQFIMLEFPFIDSELYDEWDPRGMKLYWKMRRYVCRSNNHRLAGYWQRGLLATEGFQGTWAKALNISQSTISKLLRWMEEKRIITCGHRSRTAGDPNVYILGRVFHVEGSNKPVEVFFMDHHYQAQSLSKAQFQDDTAELDPVLAGDVQDIEVPLKLRKQDPSENETYSLENETYSPQNKTYSLGKTSNIEDRIVEDRITESPTATEKSKSETPSTFQEWMLLVRDPAANKPALVRAMHQELYPDRDPPDYGYCGKVARRVGGYEVLMMRLWELSPRPPVGDVLAYVQGMKKGKGNGNARHEHNASVIERARAKYMQAPPVEDTALEAEYTIL